MKYIIYKLIFATLFFVAIPVSAIEITVGSDHTFTVPTGYNVAFSVEQLPHVDTFAQCTDDAWYAQNGSSYDVDLENDFPWTTISASCWPDTGTYRLLFATSSASRSYYINTGLGLDLLAYADIYIIDGAFINQTRLVSFEPENGTTTGTSVTFRYHAYINILDLGVFNGFEYNFCYKKQLDFSFETCLLDSVHATSSGDFFFTQTVTLEEGNYIVNADLQPSFLGGIFVNPFLDDTQRDYHQFIVGTGTFIGNLFQNGIDDISDQIGVFSTSTSLSALSHCNPLSDFDVLECISGLFFPSPSQIDGLKDKTDRILLVKFPFGYITRFVDIIQATSTVAFPVMTYTFPSSSFGTSSLGALPTGLASSTITIDPFGKLTATNSPINSLRDPKTGKTSRQILMPLLEAVVYMGVLFKVISELLAFKDDNSVQKT